jgi:hypothetical protein
VPKLPADHVAPHTDAKGITHVAIVFDGSWVVRCNWVYLASWQVQASIGAVVTCATCVALAPDVFYEKERY